MVKAKLAAFMMRLIARTWRITVVGDKPTGPSIIAFWHGEMLPIWYIFKDLKPTAIVSSRKDGSLLSTWLSSIGFDLIRGSSSKGGREVLRLMIDAVQQGPVLITPDGPRGPAKTAKAGALVASHRTGVPVTMARMSVSSAKVFHRSWDSFILPFPFASITVTLSKPFPVPSTSTHDDINELTTTLEDRLNQLI